MIAGSLIMAMVLDLKMSIIFFVAGFLVSGIMYFILSRSLPLYKKIQQKLDGLSRITGEGLSGVRVIRAFGKSAHEKERFSDENAVLTKISVRVGRLNAYLNPLTFAVINLGIVLILYFGGVNVNTGALTQGEIIAFTNYMTQILLSIIVFANVIVIFTKAAASITRVEDVLNTKPTMEEGTLQEFDPENGSPAVAFENVDFSFTDAEEKVLSDIRLEIKKGQTVGIIGGTGAGKSAMINLMLRLYDADSGYVRVFGHDVRDFTFRALRSTVHIVSQGSRLFKGTVLDNLTCGKTDVPDEQIEAALRISQSAEFVEKLPDRLQTPVEEGGKNFSGGQRQRLCIARALVGDPEILIFDDSSSALDYATDAKMRRAIATELSGKTIILVSQRVSTVRNADQIVLMDDGKICGIGTHEQLFRDNELYREICHSQLSEKEAANA